MPDTTLKYAKFIMFSDDREHWLVEVTDPWWLNKLRRVGAVEIPPADGNRHIFTILRNNLKLSKRIYLMTDEARIKQANKMREINAKRLAEQAARKESTVDEE